MTDTFSLRRTGFEATARINRRDFGASWQDGSRAVAWVTRDSLRTR